ncbi:Exosome complex component MTR3 [Cyphellophora attinorum]|uniref:Exosome complex component MTR3 n=1 Tax=Cyphellophora attinorum TaxID=1664694 RepID=A0A0N1H8J5_9EURO|nr:Exosome complex component MTR3 [Phialophora attinorum]KPI38262.1 Exosome complex component MTR3 [Phialophora attinorum]
MTDRRRVNGPAGGTQPLVPVPLPTHRTQRSRRPDQLRNIFLHTGTIPAASGSAYYELEAPSQASTSPQPRVKLSCAVHGPKPLTRNASFSPNLQLSAAVKYAPFATRLRRGYIRDSTERDLGIHLENALKGLIIPDRWPKSSIEVSVLVLEGEDNEDLISGQPLGSVAGQIGLMNILAGCITVATAALLDAKIDCLDVMAGGVAAVVAMNGAEEKILDPSPAEHEYMRSACVVGYLPNRDEVTEVWTTGAIMEQGNDGNKFDDVVDSAVSAAKATASILMEVLIESAKTHIKTSSSEANSIPKSKRQSTMNDIEMKT